MISSVYFCSHITRNQFQLRKIVRQFLLFASCSEHKIIKGFAANPKLDFHSDQILAKDFQVAITTQVANKFTIGKGDEAFSHFFEA
jgi:hypothetical protein